MSTLRDRVRAYLYEHELEQQEFAKLAGVAGSSISSIFTGRGVGKKVTAKVEAVLGGDQAPVDILRRDQVRHLFNDMARETWRTEFAPFEERVRSMVNVLDNMSMTRYEKSQDALKAVTTRLDYASTHRDNLHLQGEKRQVDLGSTRLKLDAEHTRLTIVMVVGAVAWCAMFAVVLLR